MEDRKRPVNWSAVVARTAKRSGLPVTQVEAVLEAFVEVVHDAAKSLETVRLQGLGTLAPEWHEPHVVRAPRDARKMYLDGRYQVRFRVAEPLRRALAGLSPQHWRDAQHQTAWRVAETLVSDLELYHGDKVPRGLLSLSASEIEDRCTMALGQQWRRAVQTFEQRVPAEVRAARNHLIEAARTRWSERRDAGPSSHNAWRSQAAGDSKSGWEGQ